MRDYSHFLGSCLFSQIKSKWKHRNTDSKGREKEKREEKVECTSQIKYILNPAAISLCSFYLHSMDL